MDREAYARKCARERDSVFQQNADNIRAAFARKSEDGADVSVLFIIDCEDSFGRRVAEAWTEPHELGAQHAVKDGGCRIGSRLYQYCGYTFDIGEKLLKTFPGLPRFETPPKGQMIVGVIAAGGITTYPIALVP